MPRRIRSNILETRTARLKLPRRNKPYSVKLATGLYLHYRRNERNGTWSVRIVRGRKIDWTKTLGPADDFAGTPDALDFFAAQAKGFEVVHGGAVRDKRKPATVSEAVADYKLDLEARAGDPTNATRIARHLEDHPLADKIVGALDVRELKAFRSDLLKRGLSAGAVNRVTKCLKAALNLAAAHDTARIRNANCWRLGLAALPGAVNARRLVLPDATICTLVECAKQEGPAFALYSKVLAVSGSRPAQVRRLLIDDLLSDRLLMPRSRKGKNRERMTREVRPVPISASLVAELRKAAGDRLNNAPLLLKDDGRPWDEKDHRWPMHRTVERAGLKPREVTIYCYRHSSIKRMLMKGVPIAIVADHHDTSEREIRTHYGRFLSEFTDAMTRATLLDLDAPVTDNAVTLR
jgi:hypothetical protein